MEHYQGKRFRLQLKNGRNNEGAINFRESIISL